MIIRKLNIKNFKKFDQALVDYGKFTPASRAP